MGAAQPRRAPLMVADAPVVGAPLRGIPQRQRCRCPCHPQRLACSAQAPSRSLHLQPTRHRCLARRLRNRVHRRANRRDAAHRHRSARRHRPPDRRSTEPASPRHRPAQRPADDHGRQVRPAARPGAPVHDSRPHAVHRAACPDGHTPRPRRPDLRDRQGNRIRLRLIPILVQTTPRRCRAHFTRQSTPPAVESVRGVVPVLPRARFPRPLAAPGVRVSTHRALHGCCRQAGLGIGQGVGILLPR
jgi:hypothetical protein